MRLFFLLLVITSLLRAATAGVEITPPPAWIDRSLVQSHKPTPQEDASYGWDYLLLDHQINLATDESYEHNVYRITAEGSLQSASRLSWGFDPSYESLSLHHLRVLRDGIVQERLAPKLIQVIQQENDLDRHQLNGRLTAFVVLEDIRVGDVVDYASTRRGSNPVFAGNYMEDLYAGWSVPVRHQRIRITTPSSRPLPSKELRTPPLTLKFTQAAGQLIYNWEGRNLPIIASENETPAWHNPYPLIQLSEFKTWSSVVAWARPLYGVPDPLPEAVVTKARELTAGLASDEDKTIALLQFVQQEIRYLGLELGPGTHRPTAPDVVLARRFGDCKDKTLLFCTFMRAVRLEAWPALVNTTYKDKIADWLPSACAFDHVIACVPRGNALWWVDPTLSYQKGGALYRGLPDYRMALPIKPDSDALVPVTRPTPSHRRIQINEHFTVPSFDAPADFVVSTRYSGSSADNIRSYFAQTAAAQINKDYLNYYASAYDGVSATEPVTWSDDHATNTVTVRERYDVGYLWKPVDKTSVVKAEFYPKAVADYVDLPSTPVRSMPLRLSHPVNLELTTRVSLPVDWSDTNTDNTVRTEAFNAVDKLTGVGREVTMTYGWESHVDHLPAEKVAAYITALERVRTTLGYNLTYDRATASSSPAAADSAPFRFNWLPVVLILLTVLGLAYLGRRLFTLPSAQPPPIPGPGDEALTGLGGWLILVGLGVMLRPVILAGQLVRDFSYPFNLATWESLTTPGTDTYLPLYGTVVLVEVVGNTITLGASLLLIVFYFARKRAFPGLFIGLMAYSVVFMSVDAWFATKIAPDDTNHAETITGIVKLAVQSLIWIPYMRVSRRVKLTFTR